MKRASVDFVEFKKSGGINMKVFVCLFAVIAYASASVISSGWNDWPSTYSSGWGHAVAPVKVVKVVAPSHGWNSGWSSGWKPSYSSGWWPSSGWSSGWPSSSSSGWNAWPSKVSYGWPSKVSTGWPSSGWSSGGGWPSSGWSSGGWNNGWPSSSSAGWW